MTPSRSRPRASLCWRRGDLARVLRPRAHRSPAPGGRRGRPRARRGRAVHGAPRDAHRADPPAERGGGRSAPARERRPRAPGFRSGASAASRSSSSSGRGSSPWPRCARRIDGGLFHEQIVPMRRGLGERVVRRVVVSDAFGLCRDRLSLHGFTSRACHSRHRCAPARSRRPQHRRGRRHLRSGRQPRGRRIDSAATLPGIRCASCSGRSSPARSSSSCGRRSALLASRGRRSPTSSRAKATSSRGRRAGRGRGRRARSHLGDRRRRRRAGRDDGPRGAGAARTIGLGLAVEDQARARRLPPAQRSRRRRGAR